MKDFLILGNWKLNKTVSEAVDFIKKLLPLVCSGHSRFGIAAPFTCLDALKEEVKGTEVLIGAQNISDQKNGAFTGEISTLMVKDAGAHFSLIGHSERRLYYHEDNQLVKKKVKRALLDGVRPVLCIGETLEEREAGKATQVLEGQLLEAISDLNRDELYALSIAYEPVWAIGTGRAATAETAQQTHKILRDFLARKWGDEVCYSLKILYGGSVSPDNIKALLAQPDIDGALVGGASLDVEVFAKLINCAREISL